MKTQNSGQTVLEFAISATLVTITLAGAGWVLRAEWDRLNCAYVVFERTREALAGERPRNGRISVRISDHADRVQGEGSCGGANEQVVLKKIEPES